MDREVRCKYCGKTIIASNYSESDKYNYVCESCARTHHLNSTYHMSSDSDGNVTTTYADGSTVTYSSAQVSFRFWVVVIPIILVIIGAFLGIRYWSFSNALTSVDGEYEISSSLKGNGSDALRAMSRNASKHKIWKVYVSEIKKDYWSNLFDFFDNEAKIDGWRENGRAVCYFDLGDYDADTGLSGEYYLTTIGKEKCMVDKDDKKIYLKGSELFDKNYSALEKLTFSQLMKSFTKSLSDGKYGYNKTYETKVLKNGSLSLNLNGTDRIQVSDNQKNRRVDYIIVFRDTVDNKLGDISKFERVKK